MARGLSAADDARVVKEGLDVHGKPLKDIANKPMKESTLDDMAAASTDEAGAKMVLRKEPLGARLQGGRTIIEEGGQSGLG